MVTLSKGMCLLVMVAWVSFVTRLAFTGVHLYVGFKCSFNDTMISTCDGVDTLRQSTYDIIETASFYVEGTTLAGFLGVLFAWDDYRVARLCRGHLLCTPVFYTFGGLITTGMILEPRCTLDTMLTGGADTAWLVGYEFELSLYLLAVVFVAHVRGKMVHRAIHASSDLCFQRWAMYIAWWMFLMCCAAHNILFAGYDTMKLTSTLPKRNIKRTDWDSLSLVVSIATRTLLAGAFFGKTFEWPKSGMRKTRVNCADAEADGAGSVSSAATPALAAGTPVDYGSCDTSHFGSSVSVASEVASARGRSPETTKNAPFNPVGSQQSGVMRAPQLCIMM